MIRPRYRAQEYFTDDYIESGLLLSDNDDMYIVEYMDVTYSGDFHINNSDGRHLVDARTLAIWFDKKDKTGKKIFFALNDEGGGGSIVEYEGKEYRAQFDRQRERSVFIGLDGDPLNTLSLEASVTDTGKFYELRTIDDNKKISRDNI